MLQTHGKTALDYVTFLAFFLTADTCAHCSNRKDGLEADVGGCAASPLSKFPYAERAAHSCHSSECRDAAAAPVRPIFSRITEILTDSNSHIANNAPTRCSCSNARVKVVADAKKVVLVINKRVWVLSILVAIRRSAGHG